MLKKGSRCPWVWWQRDLIQCGPEPKICSKLPENCMILRKSWGRGPGPPGPLDPLGGLAEGIHHDDPNLTLTFSESGERVESRHVSCAVRQAQGVAALGVLHVLAASQRHQRVQPQDSVSHISERLHDQSLFLRTVASAQPILQRTFT